jgi:DNA polymerase-3 subunit epsilon
VFTLLGTDSRFAVDGEGVWSLTRPPEIPSIPLLEEEWVVVDVETTGGAAGRGDRVTEVAAVRVSGGEIRETYSTLVNPGRSIPPMIVSLTGITEAMVRTAPPFEEIAHRVHEVIGGRVFVAHNAGFDWGFLSAEMDRATGRRLAGRQLCTVRLARKLLPELPSRSLDALALYYGLEIESRHRALDDAVATAHVLLRFIDALREQEIDDWKGVQKFLSRRVPRTRRTLAPSSMSSA